MGSKYFLRFIVLLLALATIAVFTYPDKNLHIITCDVGQGDAVLIVLENKQILVDGGPNNEVLDCLSRHVPFWDRTIELVVLTHPQRDHYQGLIEVFRRYQVQTFFISPLQSSNEGFQVLEKEVGGEGTKVVNPTTGLAARLGLMYLEVVYPSSDADASDSAQDPNNFSVVFNLKYKDFDALFTGDIGPEVMDEVLATGKIRDVEFLKVPHHGSKNGLTDIFLQVVRPEVATIGVGKNPWGHPHQEVLGILDAAAVEFYRTDKDGEIEVVTNGVKWWVKN